MICERCGVQITEKYGSGRFCSSKCAHSFATAAKREEINRAVSIKLTTNVQQCKKCSITFETRYELLMHWKTHSKLVFEDLKLDRTRKRWLIKERGYQCEICRLIEWMKQKIPIELDHIDGHPDHNSRENLRLICPNCHAQTPTYTGKNIGKSFGVKRQEVYSRGYPNYRKIKLTT